MNKHNKRIFKVQNKKIILIFFVQIIYIFFNGCTVTKNNSINEQNIKIKTLDKKYELDTEVQDILSFAPDVYNKYQIDGLFELGGLEEVVMEVVGKVLQSSHKRVGKIPTFKLINKQDLEAHVTNKNIIVVSTGAVNFCFDGVSIKTGKSRLAFIIGHEMAHLANDDFRNQELLGQDNIEIKNFISKKHEFIADADGILNAAMAGFDPMEIVSNEDNFIEKWISQIQNTNHDYTHPDPDERIEFIKKQIKRLKKKLPFYYNAQKHFNNKNYKLALISFKVFLNEFQPAEALNNAGLCNYKLALQALINNEDDFITKVPYYLSTKYDYELKVKKFFRRVPGFMKTFIEQIKIAMERFSNAVDKDPTYIPAYINLSSALIISQLMDADFSEGNYEQAMGILKKALKIKKDPKLLNNYAIAMYLSYSSSFSHGLNNDLVQQAINTFKQAYDLNNDLPEVLFNLAYFHNLNKEREYEFYRDNFIIIENTGIYYEYAINEWF